MKTLLKSLLLTLFLVSALPAQKPQVKEENIKVYGNCNMCKDRIENAVKIKDVKYAKWDKKTKFLKVAYLPAKISSDSLQRRIAISGHDTQKFSAPDSVYNNLPSCCLYRGKSNTH